MTKRLLTELFPRFVKKSQTQHLAKGPFGEGLLEKQGKRVYLKPGEQAPEGANVQTGARGGKYYDEPGGGGGAGAGEGQPFPAEAYDQAMDAEVDAWNPQGLDYGDPERDAQTWGFDDPERAAQVREGLGVPPKRTHRTPMADAASGLETDYGKPSDEAVATDEDGFPVGSSPTGEERRAKREGAVANLGQQQAAGQTSPPDVSEPTFDGQGNIQLPGSDPFSVSDLISDGTDSESLSHLIDAYQNETGGKQSVPGILSDSYSGPLNNDSFREYTNELVSYDDSFVSDVDMADAEGFFDWLGSKAGSGPNPQTLDSPDGLDWERSGFDQEDFHDAIIEAQGSVHNTEMGYSGAQNWMEENGIDINSPLGYKLYDYADRYSREQAQDAADYYGEDYALMEKMMQKYNVDNRRRDPIVLSNKGGRQR